MIHCVGDVDKCRARGRCYLQFRHRAQFTTTLRSVPSGGSPPFHRSQVYARPTRGAGEANSLSESRPVLQRAARKTLERFDVVLSTVMLHPLTEETCDRNHWRGAARAEAGRAVPPARFRRRHTPRRARAGRMHKHAQFNLLQVVSQLRAAGLSRLENGAAGSAICSSSERSSRNIAAAIRPRGTRLLPFSAKSH